MDDCPNDPDDGHEHDFVDEDLDLSGNGNTMVCALCGLLSVDEEEFD